MHDRDTAHRPEPPLVGRPRGESWQSLQSDGVAWEGQVFIVGGDGDLTARLILTTNRIAFARSGDVILEAPRSWLRPAPRLRAADEVLLSIAAPGSLAEPPVTLALRMREGEEAAEHLVWMLGGVLRRPVVEPAPRDLPPIAAASPDTGAHRSQPDGPYWPDEEEPAPVPEQRPARPAYPVHADPAAAAIAAAERMEGVVRQSAPPVASGDTRDWNLPMREYVVPRSQRRGRWGWAARLTALVSLLALAAGLGAGRIPSPLDQFNRSAALATSTPAGGGAVAAVSTAAPDTPAQVSDAPAIGGPSGPVEPAALPGNGPVAAIQMQAEPGQGSTEAWAEPTAAPPPPAAVAAIPDAEPGPAEDAQPAAPEPAATVAPEPTATPEPAPTATPIPEPTATAAPAVAAQAEPTEAPAPPTATPEPTATPVPPTATPEPLPTATPEPIPTATPAPEPTAPPVEPTVEPAPIEAAQPAAAEPALAVAVRMATGGQTLPEFGLPPSPSGNWIVVVVDLANDGAETAEVPLQAFSLRTSAGDAPLDPSADLAATIAGVSPAWAAGDTITLEPGEATRALLLFQVDPAANGMTLAGPGVEAPIADALAAGVAVGDLPAAP